MAGMDTSSHTVLIVIYYLCKYPELQEKIRKEIFEIVTNEEVCNFKTL